MPSATVTELELPARLCASVTVPAVYNGNKYIVISSTQKSAIVNIDDKNYVSADLDSNAFDCGNRVLSLYARDSVVKIKHMYGRNGTLVVAVDKFDLSQNTIERSIVKTISLNWLTSVECVRHGVAIPPNLAMLVDWENKKVHYVDIDTGSTVDIDVSTISNGEYRFSFKYIARNDDIYMLSGVHLAGSNHRYWKVYSKQDVDLGFSTGGGSPRPDMGGMIIFSDKILIMAGSGGVVNSDNDFAILDSTFNRIATIDVSSVLDMSAAAWIDGDIFARTSSGYYALIGGNDNSASYATKYRMYFVELDNNFNVVSKTALVDVSVGFESYTNLHSGYSDVTQAPIIDVRNKKIYVYIEDETNSKMYIADIDISDVYNNIIELNAMTWKVGAGKIPTHLTLSIEVL